MLDPLQQRNFKSEVLCAVAAAILLVAMVVLHRRCRADGAASFVTLATMIFAGLMLVSSLVRLWAHLALRGSSFGWKPLEPPS